MCISKGRLSKLEYLIKDLERKHEEALSKISSMNNKLKECRKEVFEDEEDDGDERGYSYCDLFWPMYRTENLPKRISKLEKAVELLEEFLKVEQKTTPKTIKYVKIKSKNPKPRKSKSKKGGR